MTSPTVGRARRASIGAVVALAAALLASDLRLPLAFSIHGERTFMVLGLVGAGALLGALRWGVVVVTIGFAALALLWLAVALTPLDRFLADGLPREDTVGPADVVYVLASDVQPDGDVSMEGTARLVHGLELIGRGLAPRLIVGELQPPHGRYAATARRLLDAYHLTAELQAIGPVATTRDEAVKLAALARAEGWKRVLLVTAQLHSRRAAAVFEAQGLEVVSSPSREARFDLEDLSAPDNRLRAFPDILHERLGIWIYRRRGWLNPATN